MNTPIEPADLVNAFPLTAVLIGPNERILAANQLAKDLFSSECVGQHFINVLRQPNVLDAIEAVIVRGQHIETRYLGRDGGRDTTYRVNAAPVAAPNGPAVLLTFEDLTDIEEAGKMRRDFVANVSHELKTPLTALMGFVETLRGPARNDPKAQDRFLTIMEREASRMSQLVQDLLSLSRVEEHERVRPTEQVELVSLVASVKQSLEPVAKSSDVTINLDVPETQVQVLGDSNQLRQVLTNLIENGIKYGGAGKSVDVSVSVPIDQPLIRGKGVTIHVTDHGEGIAEHHIPRLTERFYRVDSHRSREVGGTGLGLAIVKHIINRHRGRLRIQSTLGQGTVFSVILPVLE